MASKLQKDNIYNVDNLTALMSSMDATSSKAGAQTKKSNWLTTKFAEKTASSQPPASSTESLLELELLKNQNLKMKLEIEKA